MAFQYQWPAIADATEDQLLTFGMINRFGDALEALKERFLVGHTSTGAHIRTGAQAVVSFHGNATPTNDPVVVTGSAFNVSESAGVGVKRMSTGLYRITSNVGFAGFPAVKVNVNPVSGIIIASLKTGGAGYIDMYVCNDTPTAHDITQYEYVSFAWWPQ